jgi:hypothetical protein
MTWVASTVSARIASTVLPGLVACANGSLEARGTGSRAKRTGLMTWVASTVSARIASTVLPGLAACANGSLEARGTGSRAKRAGLMTWVALMVPTHGASAESWHRCHDENMCVWVDDGAQPT